MSIEKIKQIADITEKLQIVTDRIEAKWGQRNKMLIHDNEKAFKNYFSEAGYSVHNNRDKLVAIYKSSCITLTSHTLKVSRNKAFARFIIERNDEPNCIITALPKREFISNKSEVSHSEKIDILNLQLEIALEYEDFAEENDVLYRVERDDPESPSDPESPIVSSHEFSTFSEALIEVLK